VAWVGIDIKGEEWDINSWDKPQVILGGRVGIDNNRRDSGVRQNHRSNTNRTRLNFYLDKRKNLNAHFGFYLKLDAFLRRAVCSS
jgi:hypothetical protein